MADCKGRLESAHGQACRRETLVYDEIGTGENAAQRRNDVPHRQVFRATT